MIYITGDKHGYFEPIKKFCAENGTKKDDVLIVLGDLGLNYYGDRRDTVKKKFLSSLPITIVAVRGNHERRPDPSWSTKSVATDSIFGVFKVEPGFDSILYALDGRSYGLYTSEGLKTAFVIGGAYSVDKYYRLGCYEAGNHNMLWFEDEQLSEDEMKAVMENLQRRIKIKKELDSENKMMLNYILSHTCPLSLEPTDMFLPGIDQSAVDRSTEKFLDEIKNTLEENQIEYTKWFCGHWHTDRDAKDNLRFVFNDFIQL